MSPDFSEPILNIIFQLNLGLLNCMVNKRRRPSGEDGT